MTQGQQLTDFDLSKDANVNAVRLQFLRKAIDQRQFPEIDQILTRIVEARPDRLVEQIERIEYALMADDTARAARHADALQLDLSARDPDIPVRFYRRLARIFLRLGRIEPARQLVRLFVPDFGDDPLLALLAMRALEGTAEQDAFVAAADVVCKLGGDQQAWLAEVAMRLNQRALASKVIELFGNLKPAETDNAGLLAQVGRALMTNPGDPRLREILDRAYTLDPNNPLTRVLQSRLCLLTGRNAQALAVLNLDPATFDAEPESVRAQAAEAFQAVGRHLDAADAYRTLVAANPGHAGWKRAQVSALVSAGETAEAETVYREELKTRGATRYPNFAAALAAIDSRLEEARIPPARFEWAWQRLRELDAQPADRAAWERRCRWVNLADHLTVDWLEARTAEADQIRRRMHGVEETAKFLAGLSDSGRGVFLATAHFGALFAGPLGLATSDLKFRWVASTPSVASLPGADHLLSTFSQNRLRLAKNLLRAIRDNEIVSVALDGTESIAARPVPFLGSTIQLSDFVPRVALQSGALSYFPEVLWQGDQITVRLVELPEARQGEALEPFIARWFAGFTAALADVFRQHPDNLRLSGGFWTEVRL